MDENAPDIEVDEESYEIKAIKALPERRPEYRKHVMAIETLRH